MAITISQIESLRALLAEQPEVDPTEREVSHYQAVEMMVDAIAQLRDRGYSVEKIAGILSEGGMPITVNTLKSYLTKARVARPKTSQRRAGKRQAKPATDPVASKPAKVAAEEKPKTAAGKELDSDKASRSSSFEPRQDTRDI